MIYLYDLQNHSQMKSVMLFLGLVLISHNSCLCKVPSQLYRLDMLVLKLSEELLTVLSMIGIAG